MNRILAEIFSPALLAAAVAAVVWGEHAKRKPRPRGGGLRIGGVEIDSALEPLHFLVAGGTGTGKTQAIRGMLDTIRARGDRVICADPGGDMMCRWWREGDTLLAALDARSAEWSPFAEMRGAADADRIAKSMIPDLESGSDAGEWQLYSQSLLAAVLERLWESGDPSNAALVHALTIAKSDEIEALVAGLPAQTLFDTGAAKMLSSVRGIVGSHLPAYRFLPPSAGPGAWSIRRWAAEGEGWLWLPYRDDMRSALSPLITAWIGEAVSALLSLPPSRERRVWLMLDEVAALGKIQGLAPALTQGRKYGLRAVLGLQSVAQLRQAYGRDGAQILLSCSSSQLVLRTPDSETAEAMSRTLGDHQVRREHSSVGPSGNSKSEHITIERLILPSELQRLPDLVGYLARAGDYPISKVRIPIVDRSSVVVPFLPLSAPEGAAGEALRESKPISTAATAPDSAVPEQPPHLRVELIPRGCAFDTLRSTLSADDWQSLRKRVSLKSAGRCSVCGGVGPEWPVELHEIWEYLDDSHTQRLAGLTTLCPACHESTHLGHAAQRGRERQALAHLAQVNGWDMDRTRHYVSREMQRVRERSGYTWTQDLSWLSERFPNLHFSRSGQDEREDSEQRGTQP